MENSLDIQAWRNNYIYQITESEDEWDLGDLGDEWNVKDLTVGDTITPDMWVDSFKNNFLKKKNHKIIDINEWYGQLVIWIKVSEDRLDTWPLNWINNHLKPKYIVIPPEKLNESEDEWDLGDLGDEWNVTELTVGDIITNDMWDVNNTKGIYFFDYIVPKEKSGFEILFVDNLKGDEDNDSLIYVEIEGIDTGYDFSNDLNTFNTYLKPKYQVVTPETLNEQDDDEWDLGNLDDKYWNNYEYEGKLKLKIKAYLIWNDYEAGDDLTQEEVWTGESIITPSDLEGFVYNYKPLETKGKTLTPGLVELWLDEIGFNPINWLMEGDFDIEIISTDPGFEEKMDVINSDWEMDIEILDKE